jgi:hypothetical protein
LTLSSTASVRDGLLFVVAIVVPVWLRTLYLSLEDVWLRTLSLSLF